MKLLLPLILTMLASTIFAQQFQLQSADGKLSEPVNFEEGSSVVVGDTQFTVVNVKTSDDETFNRLHNIVIPKISFNKTPLASVIDFLHEDSVKYDNKHIGINFRLQPPAAQDNTKTEVDPDFPDLTNAVPTSVGNQEITLDATDISIVDILDTLMQFMNMKYIIRGDTVIVMPKNAPETPLIHKSYPVLSSSITRICEYSSYRESRGCFMQMESRCDPDIDLKNFFAEFGVSWPTGSSISYVRGLGKLVVLNTEKNHIKLEKVLKQLNVYPYQVEIELQIVSFELEEITKLGPNITTEKLTTLRTNGLGKLIASPRVITQSGQQATTKGVKEYTYPTEFTICCNSATNTGENATLSIPTAEPGSFETREVGVILDVLPETSPDGEMINITLSPEYIEPPVWEEYGAPFIDANGNKQQTHMPQPFFQTYGIQTNVLIEDGETLLIGGGMPSRDGKKMLYMFLTVNLVDIKGKRLK